MHTWAIALLCIGELQYTKSAELDLDGDGKKESIALTARDPSTFTLKVGAASLEKKLNSDTIAGFAFVDFDNSDRAKEILIDSAPEAGDYHDYALVRYHHGKLVLLGTFGGVLPGDPAFPGNGSIRIEPWFGFFRTTDKLELTGGKLQRVEQAFFHVGVNGKPKGSPKMFRTPDKNGVVGVLTAGQPIDIIGYLPSKSACKRSSTTNSSFKPCDTFLVKSSSGLVGWISFEDLEETSLPWAG